MYSTLTLCSRATDLKAQVPGVKVLMKSIDTDAANVLHPMLNALREIWNVSLERSFVLHRPNDTLSNLH